jgi:outer membrane protein OmpA-like peptidoglycan-associated protein
MLSLAQDIFKMRLLSLFTFFVLSTTLFAQSYKLQFAEKLSKSYNYIESYPIWLEISQENSAIDTHVVRSLITAAFESEQYESALEWSMKLTVQCKDAQAKDFGLQLQLLQLTKQSAKLENTINEGLKRFANDADLLRWQKHLGQIQENSKLPSDYTIQLFRSSETGEVFAASDYPEGVLYVSTQYNSGFVNRIYGKTGQYFTDIIYAKDGSKKDQIWNGIKRTNPHDGPVSFSKTNRYAYMTSNHEAIDLENEVKVNRLKLVIYENSQGTWQATELFKWNNPDYSVAHGVVDDSLHLYFSSDMPGGFGGADLYRSTWNGTSYEAPINLGAGVNTAADENFPFVSQDGHLYFSSNGWPGLGGLDVFQSDLIQKAPKHMGAPVNSNADDFAFSVNDLTGKGYLSSNRNNWKDEVYSVLFKGQKSYVELVLQNCMKQAIPNASISIYNTDGSYYKKLTTDDFGKDNFVGIIGQQYIATYYNAQTGFKDSLRFTNEIDPYQTIALKASPKNQTRVLKLISYKGEPLDGALVKLFSAEQLVSKIVTAKDGSIDVTELKVDSLTITAINHKDQYLSIKDRLSCEEVDVISLQMKPNSSATFINLDLILYDFNKWDLRPESVKELDKLIAYMKTNDLRVELSSHTDSRGIDAYNEWLSQQRSNSCVNYIISKGISSERIIAKGYGEYKLKNRCANDIPCLDEEHQQNRRTELKIIQ